MKSYLIVYSGRSDGVFLLLDGSLSELERFFEKARVTTSRGLYKIQHVRNPWSQYVEIDESKVRQYWGLNSRGEELSEDTQRLSPPNVYVKVEVLR